MVTISICDTCSMSLLDVEDGTPHCVESCFYTPEANECTRYELNVSWPLTLLASAFADKHLCPYCLGSIMDNDHIISTYYYSENRRLWYCKIELKSFFTD